ncbi:NAD(P)/FAD-dependent oxidoreductase [Streptomyces sp. B8F3]|uniref:NAD(P)/FAD-dependent oxidoreductase n=1 Tax=unclassified Streptomyces TaxID=2593676 RepID=UPI00325EDD78
MPRERIVVVGAGFAGYQAARTLARRAPDAAEIVLINPNDYFLYVPMLPYVATGVLEARHICVPLAGLRPRVQLVLGEVDTVDLDVGRVLWTGPEGDRGETSFDRLVVTVGSVSKLLPVPGVAEHAHGFRGIPEALYLRDHVTRQIELAASTKDEEERAARRTFVVVGAGYTGTEVAAHGALFTKALTRRYDDQRGGPRPRWMLLDIAPRIMPEMDERMSRSATDVLRRRGVDVRTGRSVKEATRDGVLLDDGEFVGTRSLIWCVGVRPDPLVESVGLPLEKGRLIVDEFLNVPGHPEVYACGDAAAVPDPNRPGEYTTMTAQHAVPQGRLAGRNVAASLTGGQQQPYGHHPRGFAVDLGGVKAAADPFGVQIAGPLAAALTRGYHLLAMPSGRTRVAVDWAMDALLPRQAVQLGLVGPWSVPLDTASPETPRIPDGQE